MTEAIETIREGGMTAELFYDHDCENPREWGAFLWLGFPHRSYIIGDEQIDPDDIDEECEACHGIGRDAALDTEPVFEDPGNPWSKCVKFGVNAPDCEACKGEGRIGHTTLDEMLEMVRKRYEALQVEAVSMTDHSGGTNYYLGRPRDRWDSGVCGLMLYTEQHKADWGNTHTPDEIRQQMTAELDEYTSWANGQCFYYRVELDPDHEPDGADRTLWLDAVTSGEFDGSLADWCHAKHDPDESCGGFVGYEYAMSEMRSALDRALGKEVLNP